MLRHTHSAPHAQRATASHHHWPIFTGLRHTRHTRHMFCEGAAAKPRGWLAVRLAKVHGVSRTTAALGLDYYSLKKRAESAVTPPQSSGPAFVDLTSPVMGQETGTSLDFDGG